MHFNDTHYKGFKICPRPQQLQDGSWNTNIEIIRDAEGRRHVKSYSASNTFPTEEDAMAGCLEFGRRIIDGEIPEFSPRELP
jgi:hypothetical protein